MTMFESTIPAGEPELLRVSGFQRYLSDLAGGDAEGVPSTRLSLLSPSLTQDLMRFEQDGRAADLLEVVAACVRHARGLMVHLQCGERVLPLTVFPRQHLTHCPLDLQALVETREQMLTVLQVEPAVLRPPGDPEAALVGEPHLYRPLAPLLWALALYGVRGDLLPELAGAAVYRVSPAFDLAVQWPEEAPRTAVLRLRGEVASLREIATWPGMNRELAARMLNGLYLQAGLIISRSHPGALRDTWFSGLGS